MVVLWYAASPMLDTSAFRYTGCQPHNGLSRTWIWYLSGVSVAPLPTGRLLVNYALVVLRSGGNLATGLPSSQDSGPLVDRFWGGWSGVHHSHRSSTIEIEISRPPRRPHIRRDRCMVRSSPLPQASPAGSLARKQGGAGGFAAAVGQASLPAFDCPEGKSRRLLRVLWTDQSILL